MSSSDDLRREAVADYLQQQWAVFLDRPISRQEWLEEADEIMWIAATAHAHLHGYRPEELDDLMPCPRCDGSGRFLSPKVT